MYNLLKAFLFLFDPEIKPNLMVSSVQDDWAHSGKNPEIFVNVFGVQRDLGFFDMEFNDSESPASIDTESLCTQDFLTESLETVESNEDLMNMFDHYEDQINTKLNELNESGKYVKDGFEYSSGLNPHFLTIEELKNYNNLP